MAIDRHRRLTGLYNDLDGRAREFAEISQLSCPAGCGRCCDRADTEVSAVEASLIAEYIRNRAPDVEEALFSNLEKKDRDAGHLECVFYDGDNDLHCRIYPVRPLICRSFGYSAEPDKTGALLFPACRHMDLPDGLRAGGGVVRILFEPHPPVMARYRSKIEELEDDPRMRPLGEAVVTQLKAR